MEKRTPVIRTAPAYVDEPLEGHLPSPAAIAPFDPSPEQVPARTRAVVACPACRNAVECAACTGVGKLAVWVEIEVQREQRVLASGDGEARERHAALLDPSDFERREWPNELVHQVLHRGLPRQLQGALRPTVADDERVLWVLVQIFAD